MEDFPSGPVVKNLPANSGATSLIPGSGTKIPHAVGSIKAMYHNDWVCAPQQEKLLQLESRPFASTRESWHTTIKSLCAMVKTLWRPSEAKINQSILIINGTEICTWIWHLVNSWWMNDLFGSRVYALSTTTERTWRERPSEGNGSKKFESLTLGLSWWFRGSESTFPEQETWIQSLGGELRSHLSQGNWRERHSIYK